MYINIGRQPPMADIGLGAGSSWGLPLGRPGEVPTANLMAIRWNYAQPHRRSKNDVGDDAGGNSPPRKVPLSPFICMLENQHRLLDTAAAAANLLA